MYEATCEDCGGIGVFYENGTHKKWCSADCKAANISNSPKPCSNCKTRMMPKDEELEHVIKRTWYCPKCGF